MRLPKQIEIVVNDSFQQRISNLIFCLTVRAGRKNPYHIYFPKTNEHGIAILTDQDFIGQFEDHWQMALMDYDGDIESADPNVEISLFDPTWWIENKKLALAGSLLKHEGTKWKTKEEQYEYMVSCDNLKYQYNPEVINIEKLVNPKLIVVRPKKHVFSAFLRYTFGKIFTMTVDR